MRSFELLDHTADVFLRARGSDLAELLAACAEGMYSVLIESGEIQDTLAAEIAVEADDAEELVHSWLRELLFRFSAEGLLFRRFDFQEVGPTRVRAVGHGEHFDPDRHRGGTEIKAVTYHQFRVVHGSEGWSADVVFDV
jgi:SHS2 domain-containing protein